MTIIDRFFKNKRSGDYAKGRLQMMLVADRTNCSPELMEAIKKDIIDVLAKYVEIDKDKLDIQIETDAGTNDGSAPVLLANIPIKSMRNR